MGTVRTRALMLFTLCTLLLPAIGAADDPLPRDWFYPNRPADLVGLEGKKAPEINIAEWEGEELEEAGDTTLADLRGKVVVIDFWATWCGPCVAAIPKNIELVNDHKDDPFAFIAIHDAASGWSRAPGMITDKGINYPVALDEKSGRSGTSTAAYNVGFWPTYVVIDKHGIVRGAGLRPDKVKDAVKQLLAEEGPEIASTGKTGAKADAFPAGWYYGGRDRPASLRNLEGIDSTPLVGESWIGDALEATDYEKRVTVAMFVSSGRVSDRYLKQLERGTEAARRQGVHVIAVAASDADEEALAARETEIPTLIDSDDTLFDAYGVRLVPMVVVIDRAGTVRAAGLRVERVSDAVRQLLAERLPATPTKKAGS